MVDERQTKNLQLDRLRAGLVDGDRHCGVSERSALHTDGPAEQFEFSWRSVCERLEASRHDDPTLTNQLRIRRRAALSQTPRPPHPSFTLPQMALATCTGIALTLVIVLAVGTGGQPGETATASASAGSATSTLRGETDLDLADNVDFYAWIEQQPEAASANPGSGT